MLQKSNPGESRVQVISVLHKVLLELSWQVDPLVVDDDW